MNTPGACVLFLCAITGSFAPGCALLSKGDPGAARFFSLERASERSGVVSSEAPETRGCTVELVLGRVTGASYLEERLVFRNSANEIHYYRDLRWTEPPELYLKRLLARELFEVRGFGHLVGGPGPTLDVQLTTFDEIRSPQHLARAQVIASLRDEHSVIWEETLTVDRPISGKEEGDSALATVLALGEAIQAVVDRVADRVVQRLKEKR
jgi:ABC-type uncharacterized transport system auxiliary subunit